MDEITLGRYTFPVILGVILGLVYKFAPSIKDKWKSLISICAGIGFGVLTLFYFGDAITFKIVVARLLGGLLLGASASGLYEVQRSVFKPRK
jgi:hypothetical protein